MHDQDGSIVSQMSSSNGRAQRSPGERCIDGVAEVTSRRPIGKEARARSAEPAGPATAFGRRDARPAAGGPAPRMDRIDADDAAPPIEDAVLLTPSLDASFAPSLVEARRKRVIRRAIPGRIGLAVCAFAFGAILLPAFLVSFPETPVAATSSNGGGFDVRLGDVQAALSSHGDGKMLRIEGRIVNPGTRPAAVSTHSSMTRLCSSWVRVGDSPVVPTGTSPLVPSRICQSTNVRNASSYRAPSILKGVTKAVNEPEKPLTAMSPSPWRLCSR